MRKSPKIAFVANTYYHLKTCHLPFLEQFRQKGWDVHAYANPDHEKGEIERRGFLCHDLPYLRNPYSLNSMRALSMLVASFSREQFSLVHVHNPVSSVIGRIAARIAGVPSVIYTAHGFHFYDGAPLANWLVYYPIERLMAHWTDYLITVNAEDYQRAAGFSVRRGIYRAYGVGVDLDSFNSARVEKLDLDIDQLKKNFLILQVAELNANKNHVQLIMAVDQLIRKGKPVKCLLAGVGSREMYLRNLVKNLGLEEHFYFLGYRRDIPALMALCDVVVLFSKREGLPKTLLEAMAAGKPIVATDVRGSRELVKHGETGFLVPVSDFRAAALALKRLIDDPGLCVSMGRKGRTLAIKYDLNQRLMEMEALYNQALSSAGLSVQL